MHGQQNIKKTKTTDKRSKILQIEPNQSISATSNRLMGHVSCLMKQSKVDNILILTACLW